MKLYLAGKWVDRNGPLGEKHDSLKAAGCEITHDWMMFKVPTRDHAQFGVMATKDIEGVQAADAVVIFMDDPDYTYRVSFSELGASLALGKQGCMVSPPGSGFGFKGNVSWHHPRITYSETWEGALKWLEKMSAKEEEEEEEEEEEDAEE